MGDSVINLDWKNKKVVRELDKDSRQSAAMIAKKTGLSKQIVNYRINNLIESGFIKQFITFIDIQQLGYTFYDVFFKLKHYSVEEEKRVIEAIRSMPEVGWFITSRGEWKLLVCLMAKDPQDFHAILAKILKVLGDKLIRYDFFIVLSAYQLPYKEVLNAKKEDYSEQTHLGKKESISLKEPDLKVLAKLAGSARMPKNQIVEETGLTLEMVRHSIKKLEKSGIIQAYKPLLDVMKAGYSWHIMLFQFNYCSEAAKKEFISFLKSQSQVFYIVEGVGNWSLMVEFHTKTLEEFSSIQDMLNSRFEKFISNETVMQVVKEHKCVFYPTC